ncbi:hypothetical protein [Myroides odoratimimus]|uniref:hypothetical protein n=1 Tax=Myroides odoratimimus TaxID=76832 RepID=UPI001CE0AB4A|nr:hypothetical protein [Myroides odoratimimus]MCA4792694.1 hypothetical protein [Myroides odoratimimus]MCA4819864.1 hypothetical protein [Myroides odoratimimus]MDM1401235.1 hypothetical protein [Myroides odoratimimus]MDM1457215.1 hypothetical protein [Myroides odoratimimus]MEC4085766.1 hypothetical protein [Myroides odoratimimus]
MKKSILIIGKEDEGKSTTIREVVRRLEPSHIWKVSIEKDSKGTVIVKSKQEVGVDDIINGTYVIEVNGICILVIAGSPTEQKFKFMDIYEACLKECPNILIILCAKRTKELKEGFNTVTDLEAISEIIHREQLIKIEDDNFRSSPLWEERIRRLVGLIEDNLV